MWSLQSKVNYGLTGPRIKNDTQAVKDRKEATSLPSESQVNIRMSSKLEESSLPDFDSLWDYDHPEEPERKFRELLPAATASKNASYYAQLLSQIARTEGLQRKFDETHGPLDRVEKLLAESDNKTKIRYLLERERVFNSSGKPSESRPLFL